MLFPVIILKRKSWFDLLKFLLVLCSRWSDNKDRCAAGGACEVRGQDATNTLVAEVGELRSAFHINRLLDL